VGAVATIPHICALLVVGQHPAVGLAIHGLGTESRSEQVHLCAPRELVLVRDSTLCDVVECVAIEHASA